MVIRFIPSRDDQIDSFKELSKWILNDGLDARIQLQLHKHIWGAETNIKKGLAAMFWTALFLVALIFVEKNKEEN